MPIEKNMHANFEAFCLCFQENHLAPMNSKAFALNLANTTMGPNIKVRFRSIRGIFLRLASKFPSLIRALDGPFCFRVRHLWRRSEASTQHRTFLCQFFFHYIVFEVILKLFERWHPFAHVTIIFNEDMHRMPLKAIGDKTDNITKKNMSKSESFNFHI